MINVDLSELKEEKFLTQGATSRIYLARIEDKEVVVKRAKNPRESRLEKEYNILRMQDASFTPQVYGLVKEPDNVFMVEEYIQGTHPRLGDEGFTAVFARQLSAFHQKCRHLKIEGVPEYTVDKFLKDHIHGVFQRFSPLFPARIHKKIKVLIEKATREVDNNPSLFENVTRTLTHIDLIPLNIICEETGNIRVIDWEAARMDCAEWDVASFLKGFKVDLTMRKLFLDHYDCEIDPRRLRICEALHYLQVSVWWTDINSGFEATEELISIVDADNEYAEKLLAL